MPNITNAGSISGPKNASIKAVCEKVGPALLGDRFPVDGNGDPEVNLSPTQTHDVFEAITREFWRQQIEALEVEEARIAAAEAKRAENAADPWGDG